MTLNELMDTVPAYAKDLKLNLSSLTMQQGLTEQQIWGTIAASAVASRNAELTQARSVKRRDTSRRLLSKQRRVQLRSWG